MVGAAYATVLTTKVARYVWRHFLRPSTDLKKRYNNDEGDAWAIVTGASGGIGRSCAIELAKAGFNIIVLARRKSKLNELVSLLEREYNVRGLAISIDAASATAKQDVDQLVQDHLHDKSIAILVNNVGIINSRPCEVSQMSSKDTSRIIQVNCTFPVLLTKKIVPLLKLHASQTNRHAAIMNVGSLTSSVSFPLYATYAGTKSFNNHWSKSLAAELKGYNVDVLSVRPGLVATSMSGQNVNLFCPSPDTFARSALGKLGIPGVWSMLPYAPHALQNQLSSFMSDALQGSILMQENMAKQKQMDSQILDSQTIEESK